MSVFGLSYNDTCSAVGLAARTGNVDLLSRLLEEKKDYCIKDNRGWFPIHEAACNGHTKCVNLLLETALNNDEDPSEIWPLPYDVAAAGSPLCLAVEGGHSETVKVLLAMCQTSESDLCDALIRSVAHTDILNLLLDRFPDILNWDFLCDGSDGSPLHAAVTRRSLESVKVLLSRGIDTELVDDYGRTALHIAVCIKDTLSRIAISNVLVDNNSNVNAFDRKNFTSLYLAAQNNYVEIVQLLLNHNADPHICAQCVFGKKDVSVPPISAAAHLGRFDSLKILLNSTNKVKLGELQCCSPVAMAIQGCSPACLLALLQAGYGLDCLLPGCKALDLTDALYYGEDAICNLFPWTFESNDILSVLEILLSRGVQLSARFLDRSMFIPLMIDSERNSFKVLKLLLKYGLHEKMLEHTLPPSAQKIHVKFFNVLQSSLLSTEVDDDVDSDDEDKENVNESKLKLLFSVIPNISFKVCSNSLDFTHAEISMAVPNLQDLCRWVVRNSLLQSWNGLTNIKYLDLPLLLKEYLLYSDLNYRHIS